MADRDKKVRWRAWLRAAHRDVGYLAVGLTVIYAVSGIAQNHIEDWGEVSYRAWEHTTTIAEIASDTPDAEAIQRIVDAVGLGAPVSALRAGDEIRVEYADGSKATAIGTSVAVQRRERRVFIGVANWLHTARGKTAWKYFSDAYAVLLLYLAGSGIFMIKGRFGLAWRGTVLISAGVAVPVVYVMVVGGEARMPSRTAVAPVIAPARSVPPPTSQVGGATVTPLPPDDTE